MKSAVKNDRVFLCFYKNFFIYKEKFVGHVGH